MTADDGRQIAALAPTDEASLQEYRRIVGGAVETMIGRGLPGVAALDATNDRSQDVGPWRMTTFLLRYPAQGEELPAIRLEPRDWSHRVVIWIDRLGKQGLWTQSGDLRPGVRSLLKNGFAVLAADLFGQGEFTADGCPLAKARLNKNKYTPRREHWACYAGFTFGYNRPLFSQRVGDILSLVAFARGNKFSQMPFVAQPPSAVQNGPRQPGAAVPQVSVDVVGLGSAGHWVAAARAIAGAAIDRAAIDTAGFRFANLTAIDDPDFLPGGAKYDDLPGLIALSAPHRLWLAGGDASSLPLISAAYRAAGCSGNLMIARGGEREQESAVVEWLISRN